MVPDVQNHFCNMEQFDDRKMRDEWQDAVYARSLDVARINSCVRVLDFGGGVSSQLIDGVHLGPGLA